MKRINIILIFCFPFIVASFSKSFGQEQLDLNVPAKAGFSLSEFKTPATKYGPYTRWWWPGCDVTKNELKREVELFAKNGFAGVEIHTINAGLNPNGPDDQKERQLSWDEPSYYESLLFTLEQAKKFGISVDLNAGSGSPIGGPRIHPDSSLLTLTYADTTILGGQTIQFNIPRLKQRKFEVKDKSPNAQSKQTVSVNYSELLAVIAGRLIKSENRQIKLEQNTIQNLTPNNINEPIRWDALYGTWKVLVFYVFPDGEYPKGISLKESGWVADMLDSTKLLPNYNYLLGLRTGLPAYYGNPIRAIFNDS